MNSEHNPVQDVSNQAGAGTRKRPLKRPAVLIAIALVALGAAGFGYWRLAPGDAALHTLLISGNIEAHQSLVSFKDVTSRIVELPIEEGQWVDQGRLIARLDDSNYKQQVEVDQTAVLVQQKQLASAREDLAAAQHTVINDQADLKQKDLDYQRNEALFKAGATSAQTRDLAETAMKQSKAALERDRALVRVADQNIATGEANVQNALEVLRLAKLTDGFTVLRAPFSGVILVRQTELGEVMSPGTPVVTLADLDHVWLRGYVSETDLGKIRWGQSATVTTDTYPGKKYPGRISFISSSAEFTPKSVETHQERVTLVYRIKIDVKNPNHELKPGMPADASIPLLESPIESAGSGQTIIRH